MDDVELKVDNNQIIISPVKNPRTGWDVEFKTMAATGDDDVIDEMDMISNEWDEDQWQW